VLVKSRCGVDQNQPRAGAVLPTPYLCHIKTKKRRRLSITPFYVELPKKTKAIIEQCGIESVMDKPRTCKQMLGKLLKSNPANPGTIYHRLKTMN
jgi:hypothetical protein